MMKMIIGTTNIKNKKTRKKNKKRVNARSLASHENTRLVHDKG